MWTLCGIGIAVIAPQTQTSTTHTHTHTFYSTTCIPFTSAEFKAPLTLRYGTRLRNDDAEVHCTRCCHAALSSYSTGAQCNLAADVIQAKMRACVLMLLIWWGGGTQRSCIVGPTITSVPPEPQLTQAGGRGYLRNKNRWEYIMTRLPCIFVRHACSTFLKFSQLLHIEESRLLLWTLTYSMLSSYFGPFV